MFVQKTRSTVLLFIVFIIGGCSYPYFDCQTECLNLPDRQINKDVKIAIPHGWNSYLIDEPISIDIIVIGNNKIYFSKDFGIEVYKWDDTDWRALDLVDTQYIEADHILFPAKNNPLYYGFTMFVPIIEDKLDPIRIRIVVFGKRMSNNHVSDITVAAFKDIWIYPAQ